MEHLGGTPKLFDFLGININLLIFWGYTKVFVDPCPFFSSWWSEIRILHDFTIFPRMVSWDLTNQNGNLSPQLNETQWTLSSLGFSHRTIDVAM